MANTDAPAGLQPLRNPYGTTVKTQVFTADTGAHIYRGQLVQLAADGEVEPIDSSSVATADVHIVGVAAHHLLSTASDRNLRVYVAYGDEEWVIQADDNTIDTESEFRGFNYEAINAEAGSLTTGDSSMELDGDQGGTADDDSGTGARIFRIVDRYKGVDNEVTTGDATNAKFIVRLNRTYLHYANSVGI